QPADGVSYAAKLTPDDARVDWSSAALHVDRRIRACTPAPGAWTTFHGERLKLGPVRPAPGAEPLAPGRPRASKPEGFPGTGPHPGAAGGGPAAGQTAQGRGGRGARRAPAGRGRADLMPPRHPRRTPAPGANRRPDQRPRRPRDPVRRTAFDVVQAVDDR